jgi:hypothetical protein
MERSCGWLACSGPFASMSHRSDLTHAGIPSSAASSYGCNACAFRTRSYRDTFLTVTRPPGWAFAPPLELPDLLALMVATSNVGRSVAWDGWGDCAATGTATAITIPSSIRMLQEPGRPRFVSLLYRKDLRVTVLWAAFELSAVGLTLS